MREDKKVTKKAFVLPKDKEAFLALAEKRLSIEVLTKIIEVAIKVENYELACLARDVINKRNSDKPTKDE